MLECGYRILASDHFGHQKSSERYWFVGSECLFQIRPLWAGFDNRFNFSVIKSILCWTFTRTPAQMDPLYMAIRMKTFTVMNVIWSFRNCWPRIRVILLLKMSCSTPTSEKVGQPDDSAVNDYPIRSIRIHWRCRCADSNWKESKSSLSTQKRIVSVPGYRWCEYFWFDFSVLSQICALAATSFEHCSSTIDSRTFWIYQWWQSCVARKPDRKRIGRVQRCATIMWSSHGRKRRVRTPRLVTPTSPCTTTTAQRPTKDHPLAAMAALAPVQPGTFMLTSITRTTINDPTSTPYWRFVRRNSTHWNSRRTNSTNCTFRSTLLHRHLGYVTTMFRFHRNPVFRSSISISSRAAAWIGRSGMNREIKNPQRRRRRRKDPGFRFSLIRFDNNFHLFPTRLYYLRPI